MSVMYMVCISKRQVSSARRNRYTIYRAKPKIHLFLDVVVVSSRRIVFRVTESLLKEENQHLRLDSPEAGIVFLGLSRPAVNR